MLEPSPSHLSQAPKGELNENILGDSSSKLILQLTHAKSSLNTCSLLGSSSILIRPFPKLRASSTDSVILSYMSFCTINLSTSISIVCFLFLFKIIGLSRLIISPLTLALKKPFLEI